MPDELQEVNGSTAEAAAAGEDRPATPPADERPPEQSPSTKPPISRAFSVLLIGLRTSWRAFVGAWRGQAAYGDAEAAATQMAASIQEQAAAELLANTQRRAENLRQDLERKSAEAEGLRAEIRRLKSELRDQAETAAVAETRWRGDVERATDAVREKEEAAAALRDQIAHAAAVVERQQSEIAGMQAHIGELEGEVAKQGESAAALQQRQREQEEASAALDAARREIYELNSTLQSREGEMKTLQLALEERDRAAAAAGETWKRVEAQLQEQARESRDSADRISSGYGDLQERFQQLQQELGKLREKAASAEGLEKQLVRKSEESTLLRDDLVGQRRRVGELETELAGSRDTGDKHRLLKSELDRKNTQVEAMGEQMSRLSMRAEKLEVTIREFYLQTIDPVTVAAASAELVAGSRTLAEPDRENLEAMRKNLDLVLRAMKEFVAQMNELGINPGSRS